MIHAENKVRKDFRIRNLKLDFQNKEVEVDATWLDSRRCMLMNYQSLRPLEQRMNLVQLCNSNSVTFVFFMERWDMKKILTQKFWFLSSYYCAH